MMRPLDVIFGGGFIEGGFVRYNAEKSNNKKIVKIVILGGSTSDGYFQNYADGFTWPLLLQSFCNQDKEITCDIWNGAVGGFSSSRELRKLFTEVTLLDPPPDFIISLNGINEMPDYDGTAELIYPYYNKTQISALNHERFIKTDTSFVLFPNTKLLIRKIVSLSGAEPKVSKTVETQKYDSLINKKYSSSLTKANFENKANLWAHNISLSDAIASHLGAQYLVFLQPTLGLTDVEISTDLPLGEQRMIARLDSKNYTTRIRALYKELVEKCKDVEYCINLSAILEPHGTSVYSDWRHPNQDGNQIIAQSIYQKIKSNF